MPLLAGAFLVGLARWRLFISNAMQRLATRLIAHPHPDDLRTALADAFDDPSLELVYRRDDPAGWVDARGWPVEAPAAGSAGA